MRDSILNFFARGFADAESKGDVVVHVHVFEQCVVLKDKADAAVLNANVRGVVSAEKNASSVGCF